MRKHTGGVIGLVQAVAWAGVLVWGSAVSAAVLYNESFETPGSTDYYAEHWEWDHPDQHGGVWGSAGRRDWRAYSGTWEATIQGTWAESGAFGGWWQEIAASVGTVYRASAWFWADSNWTAEGERLEIQFYNGLNQQVGSTSSTDVSGSGQSWVNYSVEAAAPTGAEWVRVQVVTWGNGYDGSLQFDDVSLIALPEPSSALLFGLGAGSVLWLRKKHRMLADNA